MVGGCVYVPVGCIGQPIDSCRAEHPFLAFENKIRLKKVVSFFEGEGLCSFAQLFVRVVIFKG